MRKIGCNDYIIALAIRGGLPPNNQYYSDFHATLDLDAPFELVLQSSIGHNNNAVMLEYLFYGSQPQPKSNHLVIARKSGLIEYDTRYAVLGTPLFNNIASLMRVLLVRREINTIAAAIESLGKKYSREHPSERENTFLLIIHKLRYLDHVAATELNITPELGMALANFLYSGGFNGVKDLTDYRWAVNSDSNTIIIENIIKILIANDLLNDDGKEDLMVHWKMANAC